MAKGSITGGSGGKTVLQTMSSRGVQAASNPVQPSPIYDDRQQRRKGVNPAPYPPAPYVDQPGS